MDPNTSQHKAVITACNEFVDTIYKIVETCVDHDDVRQVAEAVQCGLDIDYLVGEIKGSGYEVVRTFEGKNKLRPVVH
tara:strand:+ start:4980 stop:5213 length:234 start_codon:yes stop_codon:yes gene_type:complete